MVIELGVSFPGDTEEHAVIGPHVPGLGVLARYFALVPRVLDFVVENGR